MISEEIKLIVVDSLIFVSIENVIDISVRYIGMISKEIQLIGGDCLCLFTGGEDFTTRS